MVSMGEMYLLSQGLFMLTMREMSFPNHGVVHDVHW